MAKEGLFVGTWMVLTHIGWGVQTHTHEFTYCARQTDRVRKMREPQYGLGAGSSMLPCSRLELEFLSYSEVILVKVGGQIILCSTALA